MTPLSSEDGLTLIEIMVAAALSMLVLGAVGAALWTATRTTRGAEQETNTLEDARLAVAQIERDIRGANEQNVAFPPAAIPDRPGCDFGSSPPVVEGQCLDLQIQTPQANTDYIRYRVEGTSVVRDADCTSTFTSCTRTDTEFLVGVANRARSVAAFTCDASTGQALIGVTLLVEPLQTIAGGDGGALELETSVAARNLSSC